METGTIAVALVVLAVVVLAGGTAIAVRSALLPARRTARLRKHFGTEYEHALQAHGDTASAERDLSARLHRRRDTELRELTAQERRVHADAWAALQQVFVDDPERAVRDARALVGTIMADLGHPDHHEDFEQRLRDLSVDHPDTVARVRRTQEAGHPPDQPPTEHLREVLVAYRRLADALLGGALTVDGPGRAALTEGHAAQQQEREPEAGR